MLAFFELIIFAVAVIGLAVYSKATGKKNRTRSAYHTRTISCPNCGSPAELRGGHWECPYCGDSGSW